MRALKLLVGLAAAVLAHAVALELAPAVSRGFDLFVVVVVLHSLDGRSLAGLAGGLAAGMVQDALTGGLFGLYGIADTIIGYGVARVAQRLVIERPGGVAQVAAVAVLVQQVVVVGLVTVLLPDPSLPDPLWVALRAAISGVVAMFLFAGGGWWRGASEQRRRNRMQRLHMD